MIWRKHTQTHFRGHHTNPLYFLNRLVSKILCCNLLWRWESEGKTLLSLVWKRSLLPSCRRKGPSERSVPWTSMSAWHLQVPQRKTLKRCYLSLNKICIHLNMALLSKVSASSLLLVSYSWLLWSRFYEIFYFYVEKQRKTPSCFFKVWRRMPASW